MACIYYEDRPAVWAPGQVAPGGIHFRGEAQARADQFRVRAEQFERQAEKAAAAGRTKDAEEARASAEQWRQWAEAAVQSLGRR